jgi:hypothetical protein
MPAQGILKQVIRLKSSSQSSHLMMLLINLPLYVHPVPTDEIQRFRMMIGAQLLPQ